MIVSIHQPNLFPWLGFFQKVYNADKFVYLDHALTNPRNPLWQKRVKILIQKKPNWITIPLRSSDSEPFLHLNQIEIQSSGKWEDKMFKTIVQSYSKAPYFEETQNLIASFFNCESQKISERNRTFIESVCEWLRIDTERRSSSEWMHQSTSNQLLVDIVSEVNGTTYLSGDGAEGYQKSEDFESKGIKLMKMNFKHPQYAHFNTRESHLGLSIIDVLMNLGQEGTIDLLRKNSLNN